MPTTTAKHGLRIPVGGDPADAPVDWENFTDDLETIMATYGAGSLASRGAAAKSGKIDRATDGDWSIDTGSAWVDLITDGYSGQLDLPGIGSSKGIVIGGDCHIYRDSADLLRSPDSIWFGGDVLADSAVISGVSSSGKVKLWTGGAGTGGISFGSSFDASIDRAGANHLTTPGRFDINGFLVANGAFKHQGTEVGFYGTSSIAKQTGVAVTAAGVHAALVNLGLIS
jgi:hypothetical protein